MNVAAGSSDPARVLVTGATGFVGRNALVPLLQQGYEVHAASSKAPPSDAPADIRWHQADLLDNNAPSKLMRAVAPTHLLHLAWYAEPGAVWQSPENLRWVSASLDLLRAFADEGGQRAVFAGTCAEYEWADETHCVENQTPLHPATLYGASKHALRIVAEAFAATANISLAWARIFFLFGPYEDPRRLISSVTRSLIEGQPAETSHGQQVRDYLFAPELAQAFTELLRSDVQGPINVASGQPVRIRELVQELGRVTGREDLLAIGARQAPSGEPSVLTADVRRLHDEVGWKASLTTNEALKRTVDWWRSTQPHNG